MMRAETQIRKWLLGGLLMLATSGVHAQSVALPRVEVVAPGELRAGQHAQLQVTVQLPAQAGRPLLLTPFREGEAVEVVRGRLLRSDAREPSADVLQFSLPVLAHAAGSAVVGVKVLAYLCTPDCRAVEVEARTNLVVLP